MADNAPEYFFRIDFELPGLNEIIRAGRSHWSRGARQKKDVEDDIMMYINLAMWNGTLGVVDYPVIVLIEYYEHTRRRDCDNIQAGAKFILDALKKSGVIEDDGRGYVTQVYSEIIDTKEPSHVDVRLLSANKYRFILHAK